MSVLQNNINTYQTNTDYVNDVSKDYPNISYIQGTDEVKWNKYDPDHIVCVYNVTSTSEATKLINSKSEVSYQIIDGVKQDTVQRTYIFDTLGEHTVKYKLNGTSVPNRMFYSCNDLKDIIIPNNVTTFGYDVFGNGDSSPQGGVKHITIGSGLATIATDSYSYGLLGTSATRRCESIKVDNNNTTYDSRNNCNALIETATNTLLVGCNTTVIPNSVTSIGDFGFYNCRGLTDITIPDSVTSIGQKAFKTCTGLTSINIPNSVTSIGQAAFGSCTGLTSITIGNGVTSIGDFGFGEITNLTTITIEATTPPTLGTDPFYMSFGIKKIYVPAESVDAYKAANGWSKKASIIQPIS